MGVSSPQKESLFGGFRGGGVPPRRGVWGPARPSRYSSGGCPARTARNDCRWYAVGKVRLGGMSPPNRLPWCTASGARRSHPHPATNSPCPACCTPRQGRGLGGSAPPNPRFTSEPSGERDLTRSVLQHAKGQSFAYPTTSEPSGERDPPRQWRRWRRDFERVVRHARHAG